MGKVNDMKKKIIILGIVVMLICVGLSGCQESTGNGGGTTGDTSKVELVSYNVETKSSWYSILGDGFIHDDDAGYYEITGTIKNIAGYKIDTVKVTAKLFDSNFIFLDSKYTYVSGIPDTYTEDFKISFNRQSTDGFENADSVRFDLDV